MTLTFNFSHIQCPLPLCVCVPAINSKMSNYKKTLQALRGDYQRAVEKQEREGLLGGREAVRSLSPYLRSCRLP